MVKDGKRLTQFEREDAARQSRERSYAQALQLFESLWDESRAFRSAGQAEPLAGLDADIAIARVLNGLRPPRHV
jgi:hypothetical protein